MQSQGDLSEIGIKERLTDFASKRWEALTDPQQKLAKRLWGILTYKWQWQIALNTPFMLVWVLDQTIPSVHTFDMAILASLPIPQWMGSWIGLG